MDPNSLIGRVLHPFGTLFGGAPDPRLGADANRQAMRNAILTGGLTTAAMASQPGATAVGSIAQGALAGQQAGAENREQLALQDSRQHLAQLAEAGIDIPTARRMLVQALSTGDIESAKLLTAALTSMQANEARGTPPNLRFTEQTIGDRRVQIANDPVTGQEVFRRDLGPAAETARYEREFVEPDPSSPTGAYRYGIERGTGRRELIGLAERPGGGGGDGGIQGALNRGLAQTARIANTALEEDALDEELGGVLINIARRGGDTLLGDITRSFSNRATGGRSGLALTAGLNFINPSIRFLTGAQMNQEEAGRYIVSLLPMAFDPPEVIQFKRRMRASLISAMETSGGSGDDWLNQQDPDDHARVYEILYTTPGPQTSSPAPTLDGRRLFEDLIPRGGG